MYIHKYELSKDKNELILSFLHGQYPHIGLPLYFNFKLQRINKNGGYNE